MRRPSWPGRRRPSRGTSAVCGVFGLVLLVLAWPTLHGRTSSVVPSFQTATFPWAAQPRGLQFLWPQSDQAESAYPWAALARRTWRAGELPLWDPHSFGGGVPWGVDGVAATLYPVRAVLNAGLLPWLSHDVFVLLHLLLAGVGAFWLARRWGGEHLGALVAGLGWMTNAYVWSWAPLEMVTPFFAFLPLVLASADAAVRAPSRRRIAVAAGLFALAMVSGNIAYSVIIATTCGLYVAAVVVGSLVRRRRGTLPSVARTAGAGGLVLGLGLALSAVALVPTLLNLARISRQPFTFEVLTSSLLVPWDGYERLFGQPDSPPTALQLSDQIYVMPLVLALAVVGLLLARGFGSWASRATILVPVLIASTVQGAWVAYHLFPGFDAIRPYARILPVALLAVYVLAGQGTDVLWAWLRRRLGSLAWLSYVAGAALLAGVFVPALLVSRTLNPPALPVADYPQFPRTPLIGKIKAVATPTGWPVRILPGAATYATDPETTSAAAMIGGTGLVPGLDTWGGYASAVPERTSELLRVVTGEPQDLVLGDAPAPDITHPVYATGLIDWELACRMGSDLVAMPPAPPAGVVEDWGGIDPERDLKELYSGPDGRAYALPRGCASGPYLATETVVEESDAATLDALRSQGRQAFSAAGSAPMEREVVLPTPDISEVSPGAEGVITQTSRDGSDVALDLSIDGSMWLVLPVAYDDGWTVTVDGRTVEPSRVDFNRLGVLVGPGTHEVRLSYRPLGWDAGLAVTLVGTAAAGALFLPWPQRRRQRRDRDPENVDQGDT